MKIIVTGGMGFIGANIVQALHARDKSAQIIVVDNLEKGDKFVNTAGVPLYDYADKHDFLEKLHTGYWGKIDAILHQGACSSTVERDGRYMMENNYRYSVNVLTKCAVQKIPLIYASSAATYGMAEHCKESDDEQGINQPLNVYGYSKWLFDQRVRRFWAEEGVGAVPVVGLRYFNVYGPREQHKGRMASVAYHLFHQMKRGEPMKLFDGWNGYNAGEQKRDFIAVDDVVSVNLFFLDTILGGAEDKAKYGIFNCGSGVARPFNDIPRALSAMKRAEDKGIWPTKIDAEAKEDKRNRSPSGASAEITVCAPTPADLVAAGKLTYIPFPDDLKGKYQSYTRADQTALLAAGYDKPFMDIFEGVRRYWSWLTTH